MLFRPIEKYPSWRYSREGKTVIVNSEIEDSKLDGRSWSATPPQNYKPSLKPTYHTVDHFLKQLESVDKSLIKK